MQRGGDGIRRVRMYSRGIIGAGCKVVLDRGGVGRVGEKDQEKAGYKMGQKEVG